LRGDDAATVLLHDPQHLGQQRHRRVDEVIAQQHREGLVSHVWFGDGDRVSQARGFALTDVVDLGHLREFADLLQLVELAASLEQRVQLGRPIEVILDRLLAPSRDDQDVGEPGADRLLDDELDRRRVDQRQHLLGHGLGGRQEPGAEAGGGDDGLAHLHGVTFMTDSIPKGRRVYA